MCVCAFSYSMADVLPCLFEMVRDGENAMSCLFSHGFSTRLIDPNGLRQSTWFLLCNKL